MGGGKEERKEYLEIQVVGAGRLAVLTERGKGERKEGRNKWKSRKMTEEKDSTERRRMKEKMKDKKEG